MTQEQPNHKDDHRKAIAHQTAEQLAADFTLSAVGQHLEATFLPSRGKTIEAIELARRIIFPGYFDDVRLTAQTVKPHLEELIQQLYDILLDQTEQNLRYELNRTVGEGTGDDCDDCHERACDITKQFFEQLPDIRRRLIIDVNASFEGDPAALSMDETIFCYPGIDAIFVHRIAHALHNLGVPLLARIMSEVAHNETGIDIHPGATIGDAFFIDHGTGIVIGETCQIGNRVKLYQGVTLGALSTRGGQSWRGQKRHPTIEDDVTIYGGAIILGGNTTIGHHATIGGSVFITSSIPPEHTVTLKKGELRIIPTPEKSTDKSTP
ncbi:serine O-acetyltransferase EpsC [Mucisphaera sp.]|uniref:serine O-acetyltransferase EpsC n=1 Tax=Mucisphaera sp. TaxID=2913024 RepID=UPI003D0A5656